MLSGPEDSEDFEQSLPPDHQNSVEDFELAPGNQYYEAANPLAAKFVSSIQHNMVSSFYRQQTMKENRSRIFSQMKGVYNTFIGTLLQGEEDGHCKGIKKRMDPTTKYRLQQQMQKYNLIQQERVEKIKILKKEKEKLKQEQ